MKVAPKRQPQLSLSFQSCLARLLFLSLLTFSTSHVFFSHLSLFFFFFTTFRRKKMRKGYRILGVRLHKEIVIMKHSKWDQRQLLWMSDANVCSSCQPQTMIWESHAREASFRRQIDRKSYITALPIHVGIVV